MTLIIVDLPVRIDGFAWVDRVGAAHVVRVCRRGVSLTLLLPASTSDILEVNVRVDEFALCRTVVRPQKIDL